MIDEKKFTLDEVSVAFFNHDSDGSESTHPAWVKRCTQWASMKEYLLTRDIEPAEQEIASQ